MSQLYKKENGRAHYLERLKHSEISERGKRSQPRGGKMERFSDLGIAVAGAEFTENIQFPFAELVVGGSAEGNQRRLTGINMFSRHRAFHHV